MARILIIDDDPDFLNMLDEPLTEAGYEVQTHAPGKNAYRLIRRQQPDLVILDMRIDDPEGGWVILDHMRLEQATAHIPVIVCTGDHDFIREHEQHLREEGSCVLHKPFQIDQLLALVAQAISPDSQACGRSTKSRA
jgi:DNA-binding NtrC family response regulator